MSKISKISHKPPSKPPSIKKTEAPKSTEVKGPEKKPEVEKPKEEAKIDTQDKTKISPDAKPTEPSVGQPTGTQPSVTEPTGTQPSGTQPSGTDASAGQSSVQQQLDDIKKALEDLAKAKEAEQGSESGGGSGGGGEQGKEAAPAAGAQAPQMMPQQGQGNWDMIIQSDAQRVFALASGGGQAMGGGMAIGGGMPGVMAVASAGPMAGGAAAGGALSQAVAKLNMDYNQAKASGVQLQPQTEQMAQQALAIGFGGGGATGMVNPALGPGQQVMGINPMGMTGVRPFGM